MNVKEIAEKTVDDWYSEIGKGSVLTMSDTQKLYAEFQRALEAANAELTRRADKLAEALRDASLQIEYLGEKFSETGTGNATLLRIHAALREWDAAKGA